MNNPDLFHEIYTPRLLLRRFCPSDALAFHAYRTLPDVARYQSDRWLHFSLGDAAAFVEEQRGAIPFVPGQWFQVAIERRDCGLLIGDIGIYTPGNTGEAELGYTIAPAHQKQGFACEAVRHIIDHLYSECGISRITCIADKRNLPSVRLMEKLGMHLLRTGSGEVTYILAREAWT